MIGKNIPSSIKEVIWKFEGDWKFREKDFLVKFIIKKQANNTFYYDHAVIKLKKP